MIITITLNPAIDIRYGINEIKKGDITRIDDITKTAGGKGINVAKVLKQAGEEVIATGFLGGSSGVFIEEDLKRREIKDEFIKIKEETRSCISIFTEDGMQTELLEKGPDISKCEFLKFKTRYTELIKNAEIICASGSIPGKIDIEIYKELIKESKKNKVKFFLDTSKLALKEGIKAKPYLIKPNKKELEDLLNKELTDINMIKEELRKMNKSGIQNIVLSLGEKGALLCADGEFLLAEGINIEAVNPVGSGDSMMAGIIYAVKNGYEPKDWLKYGVAFGTSNAMLKETGEIDFKVVSELIKKVKVIELQ